MATECSDSLKSSLRFKTAKSEPLSLCFGSSDPRNELVGFIDSKTCYLGMRMILLLDKHNNVNHRSRCRPDGHTFRVGANIEEE
jgi:hypothetical protein